MGLGHSADIWVCYTGHGRDFLCEGAQGQAGMWMPIFIDDVDALHEEYRRSGAIVRPEPTNMP
jgi:hypothetical protein